MKRAFLFAASVIIATGYGSAFARGNSQGYNYGYSSSGNSHSTQGHYRSNGTYVESYRSTNPNGSKHDNWSTKGNVNPYTGKAGTKNPW